MTYPPYRSINECQKCGYDRSYGGIANAGVELVYIPRGTMTKYGVRGPAMVATCKNCEYQWGEQPKDGEQ